MSSPVSSSPAPAGASGLIKSVLAHVGIVRSEILTFSILAFILLEGAARFSPDQPARVAMEYAGILFLFLGFVVYCYAYFRLPSSSQERIFTEQAVPEIAMTRRVVARARAGAH